MANAFELASPGFDPYAGDTGSALLVTQPGFDPYAGEADTGWFGSSIAKSIGNAAKSVAKTAVKATKTVVKSQAFRQGLAAVQTGLKNTGPIGMAASGIAGGIAAGVRGESLGNIAMAAATGAAPSGIDAAINAAYRVARGDKLLDVAITEGAKQLLPGSDARFGFSVAADALRKGAMQKMLTKGMMGTARRALANEEQRRAFDAAVGTLARAAKKQVRPMSAARPTIAPRAVVSKPKAPINVKRRVDKPKPRAKWRALSSRTAAFVRKHVPHAPVFALVGHKRDTRGLTDGGVKYVVESGDYAGKIAQKLTGSSSRYLELLKANPQKPTVTTNGVKNFKTLFAGEKLNVPTSWQTASVVPVPVEVPTTTTTSTGGRIYVVQSGDSPSRIAQKFTGSSSRYPELLKANPQKPTVTTNGVKNFKTLFAGEKLNVPASWPDLLSSTSPAPSLPTSTTTSTPSVVDSANDTAAIVQAKALLVTWTKTDGVAEPGFTDYGVRTEDMSTTFGTRDKFVAASFCKWNNRVQGTKLATSGDFSQELLTALQKWAEKRAATTVSMPPLASSPGSSPVPSGTVTPATPITNPGPIVTKAPDGSTVITMPTDVLIGADPNSRQPPSSQQPATATAAKKVNPIVAVGGGAVLGGLVYGPIGAVVGAAAGAVASA